MQQQNPPRTIDFNADLGEGQPHDEHILPWVTSANMACTGHAGDFDSMRRAAALTAHHGVRLGAHPSHEDREHFGRRALQPRPDLLRSQICRQVEALREAAALEGVPLHHVKPHGALYHQVAEDPAMAEVLLRSLEVLGRDLVLYARAASPLVSWAKAEGQPVWEEGFADRGYTHSGQLLPRGQPGACIDEVPLVLEQGLRLARGERLPSGPSLQPRTLCVHGDGPHALELTRSLHQHLRSHGLSLG